MKLEKALSIISSNNYLLLRECDDRRKVVINNSLSSFPRAVSHIYNMPFTEVCVFIGSLDKPD